MNSLLFQTYLGAIRICTNMTSKPSVDYQYVFADYTYRIGVRGYQGVNEWAINSRV